MSDKKIYRIEGYLRTLWQQGSPKHIFCFDTETYIIEESHGEIYFPFRLGYVTYAKLDKQGNNLLYEASEIEGNRQFVQFIESKLSKRDKAFVFAHNIGFDLRVLELFDVMSELGYESEPPILNDFVFIWSCKKGDRSIVFLDIANFGVRSVRQLGDDLGYEKLSVDFNTASDKELMTYCIRDVEVIQTFILKYIKFVRLYKLGNFRVTLAGQSLQAYRTRFNNNDVYIHSWDFALRLERDAYYGGRTECFFRGYAGYGEYFYLDVNSMYPYVMSTKPLPVKLHKQIVAPELDDIYEYSNYYCIADVTLDTDNNCYPLRLTNDCESYNYLNNPLELEDYPKNTSRRLIFPTGNFRTTLHDVEFRHALINGDIENIHRVAIYDIGYPFKNYIDFFYKLKQDFKQTDNRSWYYIVKLFLNSLYGKFGQLNPRREKLRGATPYQIKRENIFNLDTRTGFQVLHWYGDIFKEWKQGETAFSNPAIAGAITAYARWVLWKYMLKAGLSNVYYIDTDSIITNRQGYENLLSVIDPSKLGALELEHTARRLLIYGNKDYRLDGVRRFKGLPTNAKKIEHNKWAYVQFIGFITWLNNEGIGGAKGRHAIKSRKGKYTKGIVNNDGFIRPYHLQEY